MIIRKAGNPEISRFFANFFCGINLTSLGVAFRREIWSRGNISVRRGLVTADEWPQERQIYDQ